MPKLTKAYKDKLKDQVKVHLRKYPNASLESLKEFIKEEDPNVFDDVPRQQINSLLKYNMEKFNEYGYLEYRHAGGPAGLSEATKADIIETCKNKRFIGTTRSAAAQYNCSASTVLKVLKKGGLKSYSARPQQKLDGRQQMNRLVFMHHSLNKYTDNTGPQSTWGRLINTDFSSGTSFFCFLATDGSFTQVLF